MLFFQSLSVSVRSNVSIGCLSPTLQPSVSASVGGSASFSMASTSKVIHHEATTSSSHIDLNCWIDSNEEEGLVWAKEGEDYPWEGEEVFPQAQKEGDDAAVAMFLSGAWSFTQVLNGMSRVPIPVTSKVGSTSKPKGQRDLNNLKCSINYEGSRHGKGTRK
jgi:hypothetical protein